ncbi:MAG: hypothetical protein QOK43_2166 [Acidimicrobiaceae bacterium]|nr:hypothetical protein [Acidimicrobiaceae bacterium]
MATTATSLAATPQTAAAAAPCASGPNGSASQSGQSGKETSPPGDIPDNQAFVLYSPPSGGYSIKVPEGWARTDEQQAVTFTDKFNAVRVELTPASQAPTVESARAAEVPPLAATVPCFRAGNVSTATRRAGTAVVVTYQADGPSDPVTGKAVREDVERFEFWRNGTEAVITLSGPAGSDNVDPWRIVTDSFAWR